MCGGAAQGAFPSMVSRSATLASFLCPNRPLSDEKSWVVPGVTLKIFPSDIFAHVQCGSIRTEEVVVFERCLVSDGSKKSIRCACIEEYQACVHFTQQWKHLLKPTVAHHSQGKVATRDNFFAIHQFPMSAILHATTFATRCAAPEITMTT